MSGIFPAYAGQVSLIAADIDPVETPAMVRDYQKSTGFNWTYAIADALMVERFNVLRTDTKFAVDRRGVITGVTEAKTPRRGRPSSIGWFIPEVDLVHHVPSCRIHFASVFSPAIVNERVPTSLRRRRTTSPRLVSPNTELDGVRLLLA